MLLAHISVPLFVLATFHSILTRSRSFAKIQQSKKADPRWPPFNNHDLTTTSYNGPQRSHFLMYYLSFKSHCHSFYTCKIMEGGPVAPTYPPAPEDN